MRFLSPTALLPLLLIAFAAPVRAEWIKKIYFGPFIYDVAISGMPDFDQRRTTSTSGVDGLPGGGGMHCVPTAALNMLAYAANHGLPALLPEKIDWAAQAQYTTVTTAILLMGLWMGTNPPGHPNPGTGSTGAMEGYGMWLASQPQLTITGHFSKAAYSPKVSDMAKAMANGALVSLCYGRYDHVDEQLGVLMIDRDGGHCVTLTRATNLGGIKIWVRDPASPNDSLTLTQAKFENTEWEITPVLVSTAFSPLISKFMPAINFDPNKNRSWFIDQFYALRPTWGLWFQDSSVLYSQASVFEGFPGQADKVLSWSGAPILDAISGPGGDVIYLATQSDGSGYNLFEMELGDGSVKPLLDVPGLQHLLLGRDFSLYAGGGDKLTRIDLSTAVPSFYTKSIPSAFDALVFDDKADQVVLVNRAESTFLRYEFDLEKLPEITKANGLPTTVEPVLALDLTTSNYWMVDRDSGRCFEVDSASGAVKEYSFPGVDRPTSIEVNSYGHLFIMSNERLFEFAPKAGTYLEVSDSPWKGKTGGPVFRISRNRSNVDASMDTVKWRNLLSEELADLVGGTVIPDCGNKPSVEVYGQGKPGPNGQVPTLAPTALPVLGDQIGVVLSEASPGALPFLVLGTQQLALPFDGGTLLVLPEFVLPFPAIVGVDGTAVFSSPLKANPGLCGATLYTQVVYREAGATGALETVQTAGLSHRIGS